MGLGVYFCFAPKNEVNADDDDTVYEFKMNFKRADDNSPDLFSGDISVYYYGPRVISWSKKHITINGDGSCTLKFTMSELGGRDNIYNDDYSHHDEWSNRFSFYLYKGDSDQYSVVDSLEMQVADEFSIMSAFDNGNCQMWSGRNWINDPAAREVTVKLRYPNGAPKYTKFKITGSGMSDFMNGVSTNAGEGNFLVYTSSIFEPDTPYESFPPISVDKNKGIIVYESIFVVLFTLKCFKFKETENITCTSTSDYSGKYSFNKGECMGSYRLFGESDPGSTLLSVNFETLSPVNLNFSGERDSLGKLVQSCTTVHKGNDDWVHSGGASKDIAEDATSARIETKMLERDFHYVQGDTYMEVTLKAAEGTTISSVSGSYISTSGSQWDLSIRSDPVWDDVNRTYTFKIDYPKYINESGEVSLFVVGDYKSSTITLQGFQPESGSEVESQILSSLANKVEMTVTESAGQHTQTKEKTIEEGSNEVSIPFKLAQDFGDNDNDSIAVKLIAQDGMKITKVYNGNTQIADESGWNDDEKTYTFTINGYPGETVTYSIAGEFKKYPLKFFSENGNEREFKVYLDDSAAPGEDEYPKSVDINYQQSSLVRVALGDEYSKSTIFLNGYGQFANTNPSKIELVNSATGERKEQQLVNGWGHDHYNTLSINGEYQDLKNVELMYRVDYGWVYSSDSYRYDYIIKMKGDKIRIFSELHTMYWQHSNYREATLNGEITDYNISMSNIWYKNENIEYHEKFRQDGNIVYDFKLLKDIKIGDNDKFGVRGVETNKYEVTIKCDDALPEEIVENLKVRYNGNDIPFPIADGDGKTRYCVKIIVDAIAENSTWELNSNYREPGSLLEYYFDWFEDAPLNKTLNDPNAIVIDKTGVIVTLGKVPNDDCEIVLNKPPEERTTVNFKGDDKCSELIDIYSVNNAEDTPSETDRPLNWSSFGGGKMAQDNTAGVSHLESSTFYYVIKAGKDFIKEIADQKTILQNLNLNVPGGSSGYSVELNKNDINNGFIRATVTVDTIKTLPSDGFSLNMTGVEYPLRLAKFKSKKDMATFTPVNGWHSDSSSSFPAGQPDPGDESDIDVSIGNFDYNRDLVFAVGAHEKYEIYNIKDNLKITQTGTETEVPYDAQEYTKDGKVYYEITVYKVKYDITVRATEFDPLHKAITFNNVEGLSYYKVTNVNNERTEGDETKADSAEMGEIIHGKYTVSTGENFYFAVKAEQGYKLESARVSVGAAEGFTEIKITNETNPSYKLYKIKEVGRDYTVSGSIEKLKFNVTFEKYTDPEDPDASKAVTYKKDGIPINTLEVEYGDTVSFNVEIHEKYNKSKFKVKDGDVEINLVSGKYSVVNIISDKTIRVEGIHVNSYNINFAKSDAVEFLNESGSQTICGIQSVSYNEGIKFKVAAKTGYAITDQMEVVSVSESGVRKVMQKDGDGIYSLIGIKEDYEISIENVENILFKVTLEPTEGVTYINEGGAVISGTSKVKYGNNFEFSVSVDDAYDDSIAGMYIIVNGGKGSSIGAQKLATGKYIVSNITEDIVIKVGNIRKNSYNVTLTKVDGMDYYNSSKKVINGDNTVSHGDSFSFKVELHPAYSGSKIKVMLGNEELKANDAGVYTVPKVIENKTVTINGVEENEEAKVVNTINNLPSSVLNLEDVDAVIAATKDYEKLTNDQKQNVANLDELKRRQEQVKEFHHVSNDVRISGVDWHIKLVAVPISFDKEACTRIYKKLNSEYIVSLYDVYLWDVINDVKYTLPEGQEVTITLPKPDLTYFEKPTGIHEKDDGKISYMTLNFGSDIVRFTTDSFSPMGVIANRSLAPGRSSLLDAADANVGLIKNYALSTFGSGGSGGKNGSNPDIVKDENDLTNLDGNTGNISEKFKSRNNPVTAQGSAIRLALVLMLLILLAIATIIIIEGIKRRKKEKGD
ncbi:MAG: hypothetical protein IJJ04_04260 [Clostridia bacterium]|nr:hypothetical protein [Clostridia bacterium]